MTSARAALVLICTAALALMSGCASIAEASKKGEQYIQPPPTASAPAEFARIVVIRNDDLLKGGTLDLFVSDGELPIAMLGTQRYAVWDRPAGDVTISTDVFGIGPNRTKQFTARAGQTYFLQAELYKGYVGVGAWHTSLELLDASKATPILPTIRLADCEPAFPGNYQEATERLQRVRKNWSSLRTGLSLADVDQLVGPLAPWRYGGRTLDRTHDKDGNLIRDNSVMDIHNEHCYFRFIGERLALWKPASANRIRILNPTSSSSQGSKARM